MQQHDGLISSEEKKENVALWQSGIVNLSAEGVQLFRQLQESQAENEVLHTVLSSLHHVIVTLNNDGKCISWNRDPKSVLGVDVEAMQREPYSRWFTPDPLSGIRPNQKLVEQIDQVFETNAVLREDDTRVQLPQSKTLRVTWTLLPLLKRVEDPVFKPKQPTAEDLKPKFIRRGVVIIVEDRSLLDRMYLETRKLQDELTALRMRHGSSRSTANTPATAAAAAAAANADARTPNFSHILRTPMEEALELIRQVRAKSVMIEN